MSPALLPAFLLPLAEAEGFRRLPFRPGLFPAGQLPFLALQGQGFVIVQPSEGKPAPAQQSSGGGILGSVLSG